SSGTAVQVAQVVTLDVTPATLPNGAPGRAYTATLRGTGGTGPYRFALTAGALPTGLRLNANGTVSGTPSATRTFTLTITATQSTFASASRAYTLSIRAVPTIQPVTLPAYTVGVSYRQTITASGGTGARRLSVIGALPVGLRFDASSGVLSGTINTLGTYT